MAFFRTVIPASQMPADLTGDRRHLARAAKRRPREWAALREASRDFLTPWEPTWPARRFTRSAFRRRLKRYAEDQRGELAYAFLIFRNDDNVMVGGLTLANIRRGVAQAGLHRLLGRALLARNGYMTAAVRALIPYSFRRCGCTAWRPPASPTTGFRSLFEKNRFPDAKAMPEDTYASTALAISFAIRDFEMMPVEIHF